jgi:S-adenosylmethionine:tRNA ribosyltransferase-isomerase
VKTSEFDYDLPPELIAQTPVEPRDASRLQVLDRATDQIAHTHFSDLPRYLRPGDLLVCNDSRVIPARLRGIKPTGGAVEILLLRPAPAPAWDCLVGGKGLRPGVVVNVLGPGSAVVGTATILAETESGGRRIAFDPPVEDWLWAAGELPLPPYIHEPLGDPERYQTVYSRTDGSVASSTAGLHFTPELLLRLRDDGVRLAFVTLHIGLDTFRPVQEDEIENHRIHREWARLSPEAARAVNETRLAGGRVFAVGTTAVRVLESAAKLALGVQPCEEGTNATTCAWQAVASFSGETDLFIRPGHRFRAVDALITNFHLPRSTLLMLVSAFAGKALIERAYAEAIRERYRFYSFGDAMLIL